MTDDTELWAAHTHTEQEECTAEHSHLDMQRKEEVLNKQNAVGQEEGIISFWDWRRGPLAG